MPAPRGRSQPVTQGRNKNMLRYFLSRIGDSFVAVLGVSTIVFIVTRLLGDPATARWMGEQGRQRAREWFRWELVARRVEAAFDETRSA